MNKVSRNESLYGRKESGDSWMMQRGAQAQVHDYVGSIDSE